MRHRPGIRPRTPKPVVPDATQRRLDALQRLAERPGTPGEGEAAEAAIARVRASQAAVLPSPAPSPKLLPLDSLLGLRIQCERQVDNLRRCCREGCIAVVEREDAGPTLLLACAKCTRHLGYLHHQVADRLRGWLGAGRLSACPILRDQEVLRRLPARIGRSLQHLVANPAIKGLGEVRHGCEQ